MRRRAAGGVARGPEAQDAQAWALDIPPGRRNRKAARLSGEIVRFAGSDLNAAARRRRRGTWTGSARRASLGAGHPSRPPQPKGRQAVWRNCPFRGIIAIIASSAARRLPEFDMTLFLRLPVTDRARRSGRPWRADVVGAGVVLARKLVQVVVAPRILRDALQVGPVPTDHIAWLLHQIHQPVPADGELAGIHLKKVDDGLEVSDLRLGRGDAR